MHTAIKKYSRIYGLVALLLLFPLQVGGQEDESPIYAGDGMTGTATLGGGGVAIDNQSFKFGEYNGLDDDGGFVDFGADLSYNSGSNYFDFFAEDLGIDNRSVYVEGGKYGSFKIFGSYSETPHLTASNASTPFVDPFAPVLTLPGGFVSSGSTSGMTTLSNDVRPVELRIDRRTAVVGASKSFGDNNINISFKRLSVEGLQGIGVAVNSASRGAIVPEVVDQVAHEITASLAHNGENQQYKVEYFFSLFGNDKESITFEDPFAFCPNGDCRISRDPDSLYHKVSFSGGWNVSENTRFTALAEYGMMRQDDDLFPYSTHPGGNIIPLPRASADALMHTVHINLRATSNPTPDLTLGARYRHYQTINELSRTLFRRAEEDDSSQAPLDSEDALYTLPYDYLQEQIILDVSYRLFKGTYIKAKYELEYMDRSYREIEETLENTFEGRIRSTIIPYTSIRAYGSFTRKGGFDDSAFKVFRSKHTQQYITGSGNTFDNHPFTRKYDTADRDRIKAGGSLSIFPFDVFTLGASYDFIDDDYRNSALGLNDRITHNITADVSYSSSDAIVIYAYYNYRNSDFTQTGCDGCGPSIISADLWQAMHDDDSYTIGGGFNLLLLSDQLTLNFDYGYTESASDIRFMLGGNQTPSVPTLWTERHRGQASGEYQLLDKLSIGLRYILEAYEDTDFATDGFDATNPVFLDRVLLLRGSEPDYIGHIATLFATWKFGDT